ncbi:MAG TPA: mannosyltransferase family protein [Anaerolineales bacterium]|nr:mannosyltransferase family protein [Anaerolineales bacterium]
MKSTRTIVLIWLAWALLVIAFQALSTARIDPKYPDNAQEWTTRFTGEGYQEGHVYLLEPFMNQQVAWDSEYYLAIAIGGYDDPRSPHLTPQGVITSAAGHTLSQVGSSFGESISLSYAFFPFYPLMIRIFSYPLQIFGMNEIATATLAGVIVSALGALLGMLALHDLTRDSLGEEGALRAAFYLIIFPTGFFLVQVYSEGLFVGLAFACLAMLKREQWIAAALLGVAATMTRAVGIALIIPMLVTWIRTSEWISLDLEWRQIFQKGIPLRPLGHALLAFAPLIAFLIWKFSYLGQAFDYIESNYFGRGFLKLGYAYHVWAEAFESMVKGTNPQHTAYYITEFLGLAIGIVACIVTFKTHPELAWFSTAIVLISWGSGPAQGIHRYILGAPAVFVTLAGWGDHPAFDRAWTILSILLMGLLAILFAFNMWVA